MPSKILTRVLNSLVGIYRLPGQLVAPNQIELEHPIQLVHDLSRDAAYTSGFTFVWRIITSAAGADTVAEPRTVNEIWDEAEGFTIGLLPAVERGLNRGNTDMWLLDASASIRIADAANVTVAGISVRHHNPRDLVVSWIPWYYNTNPDSLVAIPTFDGSTMAMMMTPLGQGNPGNQGKAFQLGELGPIIVTGGAGAVDWLFTLWVGPRGVSPPGWG